MDTPKTRYSDDELQEFKQLIEQKLEKAQRDYDNLRQSVASDEANDNADTNPTFKQLEDGPNLGRMETTALAERQLKFIKSLQAALVRIENNTYGICRVTGKLIPKERLRAVPHATLSIEAKEQQKK